MGSPVCIIVFCDKYITVTSYFTSSQRKHYSRSIYVSQCYRTFRMECGGIRGAVFFFQKYREEALDYKRSDRLSQSLFDRIYDLFQKSHKKLERFRYFESRSERTS